MRNILSNLDLSNVFNFANSEKDLDAVTLVSVVGGRNFRVVGCYPILFCTSKRHVLLMNEEDARSFFEFEKINIKDIHISSMKVDTNCSSLILECEKYNIHFFPNENWGWGIQFEGENYLIEAPEYGGVEVRD
jgi:hypothetical protein